jgi:hypothetical protein
MKRTLSLLLASLVIACISGCGKKQSAEQQNTAATETTTPSNAENPQATVPPEAPPGAPVAVTETQPGAAAPADQAAPVDLNQLTIKLRSWMMNSRSGLPKSFEEWVAQSHVQVPAPPAGKKFSISSTARVILVDK